MAAALVCATMIASLSVSPDTSQFFQMEGFTVTCPSDSWGVFRSTRVVPSPESCTKPWGLVRGLQGSSCEVNELFPDDSGLYWCENQQKDCSPALNITIKEKGTILESPLLPVTEGERVTLRCSFKETDTDKPTSNFSAPFFRNGTLVGVFPGGEMTLPSVSPVNEGLYHCEHPTGARSAESRLTVKKNDTALTLVPPTSLPHPMGVPLPRLVSFLVLVLLYTSILCIGVSVYCKWSRARAEQKQQESEHISLRRIKDG